MVVAVNDAGIGVTTDDAGCFKLFFDGVRKRKGNDDVRNKLILDFFSLGIALSSRNKSAFLSFFDLSLGNGEAKSVETNGLGKIRRLF